MNAQEISFLKKTKWAKTDSRTLTIPVEKLADECLDSWFDIEDPTFAEATLPTTDLQNRFYDLSESDDATQNDWDALYAAIFETLKTMTPEELAALFIDLNDLNTVEHALWGKGDEWYLDYECTMEY